AKVNLASDAALAGEVTRMGSTLASEKSTALFPLSSPENSSSLLDPRRLKKWTLAFLLLGLAARCVRYFLRFPLWEDEAFLCVNLIDRDYAGLTDSLEY